jgi:hypothetical protein
MAAKNTIKCAWCLVDIPRKSGVVIDSHGICPPCARTWGESGSRLLANYVAERAALKADIAAFERWAWTVAKARTVSHV